MVAQTVQASSRAIEVLSFAEADTAYGKIGVKVWIFKGEILEHDPMAQDKKMAEGDQGRPRRDAA